jgi:hypothetical protein
MTPRLFSCALAAAVLSLSQPALADVSYVYTGAKFDNVNVLTIQDPEVPPEIALAQSAAAKAILLNDRIGITLTTPVAIPTGWSSIDQTGVYGELSAPLAALQASNPGSGVNWTLTNTAFGGQGHIGLFNTIDPWLDSRLSVSLHVNAGHAIDAWEITLLPGLDYGPPNWDIAVGSSSAQGDSLLYEFGAAHYYQRREAATSSIGDWTVSGSPVPEASATSMLLAGLALTGALLRQRQRRA